MYLKVPIVPYARDFLPVYLPTYVKYNFNKLCFHLPQNVMWTDKIMCAISTKTDINEIRLVRHSYLANMVTYLFYFIFEIVLGSRREHSGKLKKMSRATKPLRHPFGIVNPSYPSQ